ncbi:MAG: 2-oxo-4-hydroxy-4-carboxy-5-ureidoimidazoline decarboxylase [Pseudomonadota bacterium]
MNKDQYVERYAAIYEHSPWVPERAYDGGIDPAADPKDAFCRIIDRAGPAAQLALLRAHPDLAGRLGTLTEHSKAEQAGAGLDACSPEEFAEFQALNTRYCDAFGHPFIIAVKGLGRAEILNAFRQRVENSAEAERATALAEVHKIAGHRLAAMHNKPPVMRTEVDADALAGLVMGALRNAGADEANAAAVCRTVMAAERDGSESHGVFRIPGYCKGLTNGVANGRAVPRRVAANGATIVWDGDSGYTPTTYEQALPDLADTALDEGVAVLGVRNSFHFAAMWPEVEYLAERGLVGLAATANFPYLAPAGGTSAILGTNPMAFAYPSPDGTPFVFDFATSEMARGDVMLAARDGHALPPGSGVDSEGNPTTDPAKVLEGAQLPFGGHKGSALAIMVELLAGGVVGDIFSDEAGLKGDASGVPPGGVFVLAMSPTMIGGKDTIANANAFLERLAAQPGVRLPGQRRHRNRARGGPLRVQTSLLETLKGLAGG